MKLYDGGNKWDDLSSGYPNILYSFTYRESPLKEAVIALGVPLEELADNRYGWLDVQENGVIEFGSICSSSEKCFFPASLLIENLQDKESCFIEILKKLKNWASIKSQYEEIESLVLSLGGRIYIRGNNTPESKVDVYFGNSSYQSILNNLSSKKDDILKLYEEVNTLRNQAKLVIESFIYQLKKDGFNFEISFYNSDTLEVVVGGQKGWFNIQKTDAIKSFILSEDKKVKIKSEIDKIGAKPILKRTDKERLEALKVELKSL